MAKKAVPYIAFLIVLLLHLPFLQADPDGLLAWHSRGAYTDEGLYTAQIRNYITGGQFDINQMDGFAKAPLLSLFLLPFLYLFGTHLWVARLAILLFSLFTTQQLIKRHFAGLTSYWAWGIIGLQYFVFNYSHFAMAEMLGASCIVWAGIFYARYTVTLTLKNVLLSALLLLLALGCKTNYLYCLAILPVCIGILIIINLIKKDIAGIKKHLQSILSILGLYSVFLLLLYATLYLPNQGLYTKIFLQDVAVKFNVSQSIYIIFNFNSTLILTEPALASLIALALIAVTVALYIRFYKKASTPATGLILFTAIWLITEAHKLFVLNMAARYLVPSFLCLSILIALLCNYLYRNNAKWAGWCIAGIIILINGMYWVNAFNSRTFQIQEINNYISATANSKRTMLGTWAPTACWDSRNITLPVWEGYFNDSGFMAYQPQAIITEVDERDAGYIFSKRGINLKQQSDSIRVFRIAEWDVAVHWIK